MAYQQHYDHYPQQRTQQNYPQPQQRPQQQQHQGYDDHYQHQNYDYGYDQGAYEQYDDGYYDQHGRWVQTPQHGGYNDINGYHRQPQQGQRPAPQLQRQYPQDQAYDNYNHNYNQQQQPPQNDPRSRTQGRGNGPPSDQLQGRGGLRPPGMDRSILQPKPPKTLPQDNPFPTFPYKRDPGPPARDNIEQGLARIDINDGGNGPRKMRGSPPRGQPMPQGNRGPPQPRPDFNGRQDSGHFDEQGPNQRIPPNNMQQGQRLLQIQTDGGRIPVQRPPSEPQSPSQRAFNPTMQRSVTMPHNLPSGSHGQGHDGQQQWAEPGSTPGYHDVSSPAYSAPRPSTAGGPRQQVPQPQMNQRPPVPQQQQQQQQRRHPQQPQQPQQQHDIDDFYDDYYGDTNERKSMASSIDMPNFDAMPNNGNGHRRGDSIDDHLGPSVPGGTSRGFTIEPSIPEAVPQQSSFQQQALRGRSQGDLHGQYAQGAYDAAPLVPMLPRTNTGIDGTNGLPKGPRGRGQPPHGITADPYQRRPSDPTYVQGAGQNFDSRYNQPPSQIQRGYSGDSAYSEPPMNTMRNVASPMGPGNPIRRPGTAQPLQRPGTTGPGPGRIPSDPLGQRNGTAQPRMNPDALPSHPVPVRAGLTQQGQQTQIQGPPQPVGRPAPVRQYPSDNTRASMESQQSNVKRQSALPHPVTHDELNRLRNTWRANPDDNTSALLLAKKLVEAAGVLADEGGTADSRTRNKNREKFILEGHKIVKKLVTAGYGEAMFYLADCYGQGLLGLQVDTKEAFLLYQSGAKVGHAASAYRTAVCCEMGHEEGGGTKRDPMKAVQWYRRAASLGDTPALYKMGMILLKGLLGQQKNLGEAINMLKRAAVRADKDNPHALHELALIYEANTGNERIIQDEAYSLQLFHQAADLGYKFSQFRLGQAYEYGLLGCPIDARTSIAWYTRAAAQEEHQSELALSGWYLTGTSGILEQSDTEAYLWARKAACAEPPLPKALFAMGYFTEVGIGCPRSLDEAKRWYARAASYKFPKAQERLEELKRGGSKAQMKRERLSRTNQKQQEENCAVM